VEFLRDVAFEVQEQAIRLNTHASIAIWGGNNENEVALGWFSSSNTNRDLYVADYVKLYGDTVYPALMSVDGLMNTRLGTQCPDNGACLERPWVDSSPSNGLLSWDPYVKWWGQASTAAAGDVQ
jgi:beta-mannosidase